MKKSLLAAILACACVTALAPASHAFGIHGIVWTPDDIEDTGVGVGTRWGWRSLGPFAVEGRASWMHFGDASLDVFPLEAGVIANRRLGEGKFGLYAGATVGFWILTGDADFNDNLGATILGGMNYATGKLLWYGEIQYVFLDSEFSTSTQPDIEINMDGFAVNLGVQFGGTARIKQEPEKK